jgi:hypothetical protein
VPPDARDPLGAGDGMARLAQQGGDLLAPRDALGRVIAVLQAIAVAGLAAALSAGNFGSHSNLMFRRGWGCVGRRSPLFFFKGRLSGFLGIDLRLLRVPALERGVERRMRRGSWHLIFLPGLWIGLARDRLRNNPHAPRVLVPRVLVHGDVVVELAAQLPERQHDLGADLADLHGLADGAVAGMAVLVVREARFVGARDRRSHRSGEDLELCFQMGSMALDSASEWVRFPPGGACVFHARIMRAVLGV